MSLLFLFLVRGRCRNADAVWQYPATAKYIGGAEDDAASFECA